MSYILEALKKADAAREREREAVPGLHSRHDHTLPDEPSDERGDASTGARTPWLVGGIAGGVVIAGALFWLLGRAGHDAPPTGDARPMPMHGQVGDAAPPPPAVMAQVPTPASMPTPMAPPQALPHDPVTTPAQGTLHQAPVTPPAPAQAARPTSPQPAVVAAPPPIATARVPSSAAAPAPTATAGRTPAQDPLRVDPSLREAPPKIVTMQELPDDIRRELPQLSVGGAMHSDVAANRMLVLNGGVFREGDQPAPGVVLEEIRLKSAVLRYKGHRYSISY